MAENWPQWRGPSGIGVYPEKLPYAWSGDQNNRLESADPRLGVSSPIVWVSGFSSPRRSAPACYVRLASNAGAGPRSASSGEIHSEAAGPILAKWKDLVVVAAFARSDGKPLWNTSSMRREAPEVHEKRNLATPSP